MSSFFLHFRRFSRFRRISSALFDPLQSGDESRVDMQYPTFVSGIIMRRPRSPRMPELVPGPPPPFRSQIRIGPDQNTADGPDKLSDLWIVDGASVDPLNPPRYHQNLRSFREGKEERTKQEEREVETRRTYKYKNVHAPFLNYRWNNSRVISAPIFREKYINAQDNETLYYLQRSKQNKIPSL